MLDVSAIQQSCLHAGLPLQTFQYVDTIDSTNRAMSDFLLLANTLPGWHLLIAGQQTQGRGQHGKSWISPANGNWYFSLGRLCLAGEAHPVVDSMLIGQVCLQVLQSLGVGSLTLKPPNDILYQQRKLAGILIEHHWQSARCYASVIGIGINVSADVQMKQIQQPWSCLEEAVPLQRINGVEWLASLLMAIMQAGKLKT
jgi:BirA family biotin operon repressor/biotin-[acetyl-CoA-carboxylase] ligase